MGILKDIAKMGILVSFIAAVAHEFTGYAPLKIYSIVTGALSLSILSSYLLKLKGSKSRDLLDFRLLK